MNGVEIIEAHTGLMSIQEYPPILNVSSFVDFLKGIAR